MAISVEPICNGMQGNDKIKLVFQIIHLLEFVPKPEQNRRQVLSTYFTFNYLNRRISVFFLVLTICKLFVYSNLAFMLNVSYNM